MTMYVKDFYQSATPLPVGEHVLELYGDVAKDANWYFKIDGEIVASGYDTLTADSVPESERVITRLVAGIDGASSQDTKQVSLYIKSFTIANYDAAQSVPPTMTETKTPTATMTKIPTATITPTWTVTPTATFTPSPAADEMRCVLVTWKRGLNLRPSPSMFNASYSGMNFGTGAVFPVMDIFENVEGKWMQINEKIYSAMYLNSNGKTYAVETECK
jgi:hypothetical protein